MKVVSNGRVAALISKEGKVIIAKTATMAEAWDMAVKYGARLERR